MRRFFIFYKYLGSNYLGLQRIVNRTRSAPDLETIQGVLEFGLKKSLNLPYDPIISISGRTDAGVSALNAVCHFTVNADYPNHGADEYFINPEITTRRLNQFLENNGTSIRVHRIVEVSPDNHSRAHLDSRVYTYRLAVIKDNYFPESISYRSLSGALPVTELFRTYAIPQPFDPQPVYDATRLFIGTWNFKSFMKPSKETSKFSDADLIKTIYRTSFNKTLLGDQLGNFDSNYTKFDFYEFNVEGSGFLRRQVRKMVGILIGIGRGIFKESHITQLLQNPSTEHFNKPTPSFAAGNFEIHYASPFGLYLKNVNMSKEVRVLRGFLS